MKKISALLLVSLISYQIYLGTQFKINCGDYLKQASNANSTRMASNSLESALYFVEKNELTYGHTSAFYNTPDEDLPNKNWMPFQILHLIWKNPMY